MHDISAVVVDERLRSEVAGYYDFGCSSPFAAATAPTYRKVPTRSDRLAAAAPTGAGHDQVFHRQGQ